MQGTMLEPLYKCIPFYQPLEIKLNRSDDFLRIRETLTRIGVGSYGKKILWQTCHLVHENGRYYILHFLEMLIKDGHNVRISPEDLRRRNSVGKLISDWGLCRIKTGLGKCSDQRLRIIKHGDRDQWTLMSKYHTFATDNEDLTQETF